MPFFCKKMTQLITRGRFVSTGTSYEDVIRALNTLQTNAQYLRAAKTNRSSGSESIQDMKKYLFRSGLTLEDVDKLSIIHVTGTKGKGSTCAFTEAILRQYGYRTGFYSSPHLIHVTERIRINGQPIKEDHFAKYFWHVFNKLSSQKESETDMPAYFKFITVLMFHIFLNADIDVVILEVGVGGEYDCTNIVRNPVCVGISSLGLEHTMLLGNTLEEIAHQKSGILKENSIAFTVPQPDNVVNVIKQRAIERNCELRMVPDFKSYYWTRDPPDLGIPGPVQEINASLAVQLAHTWILKMANRNSRLSNGNEADNRLIDTSENNNACAAKILRRSQFNSTFNGKENLHHSSLLHSESQISSVSATLDENNDFSIISPKKTALALSCCVWPGRTQVLCGRTMDFYLDGAHTSESVEHCASWYLSKVDNKGAKRFLIFNITGDRDVLKLLKPLKRLHFEKVYFVPNISGKTVKLDQLELQTTSSLQHERCMRNHEIWGEENSMVLKNVCEALSHITSTFYSHRNTNNDEGKPQVLITGSLHLVGAALLVLDPNLTMKTNY
ncbi:folylpolyglutamate synthase, mitochondrial isoform X1 [Neodiprion pinetum]|uniref:folylpolyglutamate synthase, mitochondrial isoform X1 n=1 Tax=Neodiprion pinetum TaxID=441929 RepID=UPI001EDF967C|nr:folylpolyglutamate synthase, mitochondrial-like isoform X1 [Neodiprion pinetum]XP_046465560.1 folylpolyglutamate synthase, mitochondrial-like isoform X1 [Neodiprion pinetum]XP_046465561.1 folylpolyglutamate synthase, mitochondrial-like isoform X1 [Neodiprion pinetum]